MGFADDDDTTDKADWMARIVVRHVGKRRGL